jgi:hypothetical protein
MRPDNTFLSFDQKSKKQRQIHLGHVLKKYRSEFEIKDIIEES